MRQPCQVVALLVADLHLSHRPPVARSNEPDWYEAMGRQLDELASLQKENNVPVVCSGDVFDRWNSPPELINFALENLPTLYAVPGQHDLPNHSYNLIKRSAYWTLVKTRRIIDLKPNQPVDVGQLRLWGFPFGVPVKPCKAPHHATLDVAVIHSYIWVKSACYPDAPEDKRLKSYADKLKGYDTAVFGDNHKGFLHRVNCDYGESGCAVFNCGGFFRRKIDEWDHRPSVGLLHDDRTVKRHYLDCSQDKFLDQRELPQIFKGIAAETFLEELSSLGDAAINFAEAVDRILTGREMPKEVKDLIVNILERAKDEKGS